MLSHLLVEGDGLAEVAKQVLRVAKVAISTALCSSVPQLLHQGQVPPARKQSNLCPPTATLRCKGCYEHQGRDITPSKAEMNLEIREDPYSPCYGSSQHTHSSQLAQI